jgi:hypothetical protein
MTNFDDCLNSLTSPIRNSTNSAGIWTSFCTPFSMRISGMPFSRRILTTLHEAGTHLRSPFLAVSQDGTSGRTEGLPGMEQRDCRCLEHDRIGPEHPGVLLEVRPLDQDFAPVDELQIRPSRLSDPLTVKSTTLLWCVICSVLSTTLGPLSIEAPARNNYQQEQDPDGDHP